MPWGKVMSRVQGGSVAGAGWGGRSGFPRVKRAVALRGKEAQMGTAAKWSGLVGSGRYLRVLARGSTMAPQSLRAALGSRKWMLGLTSLTT